MADGNNSLDNLVIADEDYLETTEFYNEIAAQAEKRMMEFIDTMISMQSDLVLEGLSANQLVEFCTRAYAALSTNLSDLVKGYSGYMNKYIGEIDVADNVLFGEE